MTAKHVLAAGALTLLLGGAAAATTYNLVEVPERGTFDISAPTSQGVSHAEVHDPHDVLTAEDEQRMLRDVKQLTIPTEVEQIHYLVFRENRSKVNDSVEEYLRDNRPDLIGEKTYPDGVLIVGVGLAPRQAFLGAGEDVATLLSLHKDNENLKQSLDAIKPGVKGGNIPAGLIAGVRQATDVEKLAESRFDDAVENRTVASVASGMGVAGATAFSAGVMAARRRKREKQLQEARGNLAFISKEYGELATRLDSIDIRAHSLASPLAHHTLRKQWGEVRDHFLSLHNEVERFGNLTPDSDPKLILERSERINEAAAVARQVGHAEDNIDVLFRLEHGDLDVRRTEAAELHDDISHALATVPDSSSGLYHALEDAQREASELENSPEAPEFLDRYARLLGNYQAALADLKEQQLGDVKQPSTQPVAPAVYEAGYRPGYGYADFVPFWALSSWHSNEIAAQEAAASANSGVNSSYSSGFSGAGGSSSF